MKKEIDDYELWYRIINECRKFMIEMPHQVEGADWKDPVTMFRFTLLANRIRNGLFGEPIETNNATYNPITNELKTERDGELFIEMWKKKFGKRNSRLLKIWGDLLFPGEERENDNE